jgi:hypothetical protein
VVTSSAISTSRRTKPATAVTTGDRLNMGSAP